MKFSKKLILSVSLSLIVCPAFLQAATPSSPTKIAAIDIQKIMAESKAGKESEVHFKQAHAILQKAMSDVEAKFKDLPKEQRERELISGQQVLQNKLNEVNTKRQKVVIDLMSAETVIWRDKVCKKNCIVLPKAAMLAADPGLDVTDQVIAQMDKKSVKFDTLPAIASIDIKKVLEESKAGKESTEHLKKAQAGFKKSLDEMQALFKDTPKEERDRQIAAAQQLLQNKLTEVDIARQKVVFDLMSTEMQLWQNNEDKNNTVILSKSSLPDGSAALDVTDRIIAQMNKKSVKFDEIPTVTIKKNEADKDKKDAKKAPEKNAKKTK